LSIAFTVNYPNYHINDEMTLEISDNLVKPNMELQNAYGGY